MLDFGSEVSPKTVSRPAMVLELATVLLGACIGAVAVLYAAPKGYLGHPKKKGSGDAITSLESYTPATVQEVEFPAVEAPAVAEVALSPVPALYESVQPTPPPVTYASASTTSFGAPSISKKPTRTYRRRTAPVRSTSGSKASLKTKTKKR